ncbi:serine/threonine protein kinase [Streptomyces sp. S.PNR 29]|uniref:serine/threonine-protein kinase n=1 Tax=Streptomyces sp. S.PNR 29 TaxID=2973805 RepID=UPI0025B08986|nr:serine/threonine protein kinase [Streptomyces sp. S.PNR 29]MDN0195200.1 protein kinase [Streptomyces sp. S.PNR 29]
MSNDGGGKGAQDRLVGGRYRLIERIGSGGMGTVWRALDELVEREVAVKEPRLPGDPEDESHRRAAHRLYREARAAARVDHPAAVTIHDVVVEEEDGLPWIVMELIRGESLHEVLQGDPMAPPEAARIGLAVLGALRAAHAVGIVHRDVKPANVLLGPHGRVVLTDFGIAHVQGEESLTAGGEFVGSLEFVAPERMSGRVAGPASDLWSLGVLLYAAVEGWSPFRRTTVESTLAAILSADPPEPERAGPLGPLLTRLLVKDPDQRPDAEEVAKTLEAAAGRWPEPEAAPAGAQSTSGIREFADDVGTLRLGTDAVRSPDEAQPDPAPAGGSSLDPAPGSPPDPARGSSPAPAPGSSLSPDPAPGSPPAPEHAPAPEAPRADAPTPKRGRLLRPAPLALLGALLLAGGMASAAFLGGPGRGEAAEQTAGAAPTAGRSPSPTGSGIWTAHRERDMDAVLTLPSQYYEVTRDGSASDQPRIAVYENDENDGGDIQVRLTLWDRAPRSPMAQAKEAHRTWDEYDGDARTQYTSTSVRGNEAVLADTTYGLDDAPTRVMQLMIRTGDDRMYELRVDMPKGTPDEKKGTAVFKGARDRLDIGQRSAGTTP